MAELVLKDNYGLVLAGGGAKGAYEIGALLALKELGLLSKVNMISGTSIGSINMMLLAQGDLDNAKKIWENINADDFIELDDDGFDITKGTDGIFSREGLKRILKGNVDYNKISASDIPMFITIATGTDIGQASVKYAKINGMTPELIEKHVMASSAIPIIYDAVNIDGINYFDGGLVDNTPIRPLYDLGARDIIVISNDNEYKPPVQEFADARLLPVVPSQSLEMDSLIGTGDLNRENAYYRLELGYRDALLAIPCLAQGIPVPDLSGNHILAKQALTKARLNNSVERNMAGLSDMLSRFGINDL